MSALQASRKYGVPSRTLYDKVKKLGITTGRQMQRKSLPQYPASFPSLGGVSIFAQRTQDITSYSKFPFKMVNMDHYKEMADRMKEISDDNDSNSHPPGGAGSGGGDGLEGRATLVPAPGGGSFNALQVKMTFDYCSPMGVHINLIPVLLQRLETVPKYHQSDQISNQNWLRSPAKGLD